MKKTLSKKNPYYISKERRLELEHFCKQYHEWKQQLRCMTGDISSSIINITPDSRVTDRIERTIELREELVHKIEIVEQAARMVVDCKGVKLCNALSNDILYSAVNGVKYSVLSANKRVYCGERQFYEYLRQFYYILGILRS